MTKKKLFISVILIILFSAFITGCGGVFDSMTDWCCLSGLLPLPLAVIAFKVFR